MAKIRDDLERRSFCRSPNLDGIELLEATNSTGAWSVVHERFALAIVDQWHARVNHDGRNVDFGPGQAMMFRPGEVHSTSGSVRGGTVRAMIFSDEAFAAYLGDCTPRSGPPSWRVGFAPCSPDLVARFTKLYQIAHSSPTALELQSAMVVLGAAIGAELVSGPQPRDGYDDTSPRAARIRELIHDSPDGLTLGLAELADAVGLTRFQAVRSFKRRYGLPPHTYQLVLRVQDAMARLRRGERATEIAHELGFADHSHFTRHFKRILGQTPREYAAASRVAPFSLPKFASTSVL